MHAVVGAQGTAGDLLDLVEVERGVVGDLVAAVPAHDPVPAVAEGGDHRESVAAAVDGEDALGLLGQPDIGQNQRLDDGDTGEVQADRLPHGTPVTVGADDIGRPAGDDRSVRAAHVDVDPLVVLPQPHDLALVRELDPSLPGPPLQEPLDLVLRGDEQERETRGQRAQIEGEAAEEPQAGDGVPGGEEFVGEAAGVELLQGAGVHPEGAGEVADLARPLLDEGHGDAGCGEVTGEEEAGGAGADDDHGAMGGGAVHGGLLLPTLACHHLLPTNVGQHSLTKIARR